MNTFKESGAKRRRHERLDQILNSRYRIEALIASGGMSDVYRATDLRLVEAGARDAGVAVKILRDAVTRDENALSLLAREAARSKQLSHPNIIRVHDLDNDGDTWFLVMELLDGEPLSRLIQRSKPQGLKWQGAQPILRQILSALQYSHHLEVIHADLKPSNVFFTRKGDIKLLDFGVAQALSPSQPTDYLTPRHDDETTVYGYTPAYASPALIHGESPTESDDLYSFACIAHELLSSEHPFARRELSDEERQAFPLKRPARMPRHFWKRVRQQLRQPDTSATANDFLSSLHGRPLSRFATPTTVAAGVLMGIGGVAMAINSMDMGPDTQEHVARQLLLLEASEDMPVSEVLDTAAALPPLEREGLLRTQSERITTHFRQRVDNALETNARPDLPNLMAALEEINEGLRLYPEHPRLLRKQDRLTQQRSSLLSVLETEMAEVIEETDFRSSNSLTRLAEIHDDLQFLGGNADDLVSDQHAEDLKDALADAITRNDGPALAQLAAVSRALYPDHDELTELIAQADTMEEALIELQTFAELQAQDEKAVFPLEAAERYFGGLIADWEQRIEAADSSDDLNTVYEDIQSHAAKVPDQYTPFIDLRQTLADAYMEEAERLLDADEAARAQPLLRKATRLMRGHDA